MQKPCFGARRNNMLNLNEFQADWAAMPQRRNNMLNLNEFQADWAAMPQVEKEKLEKLNNKTILVSGHSLARCLCYALIYQSERQKRQIRVIYAGDTDGFDKGCTASEYFQAVDFSHRLLP